MAILRRLGACSRCGTLHISSAYAPWCSELCRRRGWGRRLVVALLVALAAAALLVPWRDAEAQLPPQKQPIVCQKPGDCRFVQVYIDGGLVDPASTSGGGGSGATLWQLDDGGLVMLTTCVPLPDGGGCPTGGGTFTTGGGGFSIAFDDGGGAYMLTDGTGSPLGTADLPMRTDPTGTTPQPVTQNQGWGATTDAWSITPVQEVAAANISGVGQNVHMTWHGGSFDLSTLVQTMGSLGIVIEGAWSGTLTFYESEDGVTMHPVQVVDASTGQAVGSTTTNGVFRFAGAGFNGFYVTATAFVGGGVATVYITNTMDSTSVGLGGPMTLAGPAQTQGLDGGYASEVWLKAVPLPSGAATESTLSTLNAKVPASPAAEHTTAVSPNSCRLSDGSGFYKALVAGDAVAITGPAQVQGLDGGYPAEVYTRSLPLPIGAATESTLSTLNGKIPSNPATDRTTAGGPFSCRLSDGSSFYKGLVSGDSVAITGPAQVQGLDGGYPLFVYAPTLPLPSGAATSALQTTGNTSLASIDSKTPASPATAGNQATANTSLSSIDTKTPALGQATAANSSPVVLASNVTSNFNPAIQDGGPPPVVPVYPGCSSTYVIGQDAGTSGNPWGQLFVGATGTYRLDTTGTCHYRLSRAGTISDAGFASIDDPSLFIGEVERITLDGLDATLPDAGCWIGGWCEDATARFKACGPTQ